MSRAKWFRSVNPAQTVPMHTRHTYDAQQRRTSTTDPLGRVTRFSYDAQGNRILTLMPLDRRVTQLFEPLFQNVVQSGRILHGVPSTQGGQPLSYTPLNTEFTHDAQGRLTSTRDPLGFVTRMAYNADGQISSLTATARSDATSIPVLSPAVSEGVAATLTTLAPSARRTLLGYNPAGDLASITNALGQQSLLGSDSLGRTTSLTDPLAFTSQQAYSPIDLPTTAVDALGQSSSLSYDSAGRLTAVSNAAGVTIESYRYDAQGRLTGIANALGQSRSLAYDSSNRVREVTDRKGQRTTVTYTERGLVASLTTADRLGRI